ncbi:Root cap [Corchorus capsularis]|uniref:Root cap n=1 Tax=Corchorus capsularis TaxID=210143 RepID=A0A1R3IXR1_COCAP|nr:Root cap [Corchorus capsularis]
MTYPIAVGLILTATICLLGGCPSLCEVDCRICKPYCACDRPGAVCQDPRFIGADGIMFYFHGKKDKDFCLVSDFNLHINAHFIGKKGKKGRDFTWVQSIGILFDSHQLYIGAERVAKWEESVENMVIKFDGKDVLVPAGEGEIWKSPEAGLKIERQEETNKVRLRVEGLLEIVARVVPITSEESRVHGYDVTEDDCFAHLELNFKFDSLSTVVNGVLGQTYKPNYKSRVKLSVPMPIMGGAEKFATSHLFSIDCAVSNFGLKAKKVGDGETLSFECGDGSGGKGIACRR